MRRKGVHPSIHPSMRFRFVSFRFVSFRDGTRGDKQHYFLTDGKESETFFLVCLSVCGFGEATIKSCCSDIS